MKNVCVHMYTNIA